MTVGQCLQKQREGKKISLESIAKATRIKPAFLQALEGDAFQLLPSEAYARGFLQSYAKFIHLNPDEVLDLYRNQVEPSKDQVWKKAPKASFVRHVKNHLLDFLATIMGGAPSYSISKSVFPPKS